MSIKRAICQALLIMGVAAGVSALFVGFAWLAVRYLMPALALVFGVLFWTI